MVEINKRYKVYKLIDPVTGDVRYIGQTKRSLTQRLKEHIRGYGEKSKTYKRNWIESLKKIGLEPVIELQEKALTKFNVNEREIFWIQYYKERGSKLTNLTTGGEGLKDYKHSPETCAKLKKSLTGRKLSESHKKNIGKSSEGRTLSQESRDKLAKKVEQEWKDNVERLEDMKARTGMNNPNWGGKFPGVVVYDMEGNLVGDFDHLHEASEVIGFTKSYIRACAVGRKKSKRYIISTKNNN